MVEYVPGMTVAQLRAQIDAAKAHAMDRFESDWGTRDIRVVMDALCRTIPGSASPADAAAKALAIVRR
ncbi:hypothetical protein [Mesorhizobium sp. M0768]|uniref:hypothetical protein n=1 Tax=Mesorhizobium sp. M0768 TaxID=2956996 RepID=UPI00333DA922